MIIHLAVLISLLASVTVGGSVLAMGHWEKLALKFGAVALCMAIDCSFLGILAFHPDSMTNANDTNIMEIFRVLIIAKNIDHIMFYLACGRDARAIKIGDRRNHLRDVKEAA